MNILYNSLSGRYRDVSTGRFVAREKILSLIMKEEQILKVKLTKLTIKFTDGNLTLRDWQVAFTQELKESHIRMGLMGAGGKNKITNSHYGLIGQQLKGEYERFYQFGREIKAGKLTIKQINNRAGLYPQSIRQAFFQSEQITRALEGFLEAKRILDANAEHCNDCLNYSTKGAWQPIKDVIVPGHGCVCRGRCRCSIAYRKRRYNESNEIIAAKVLLNQKAKRIK